MRFVKMHGCGNDYVYVDCISQPPPDNPSDLARAMSDRHRGVGSDGLILIHKSPVAAARMRMFNADGTEGEMCGNGVRCVAKLVFDRGLSRDNPMRIETGRGVLTLDLTVEGDRVTMARVDMGEPILESRRIPVAVEADRVVDFPLPWLREAWFDGCGLKLGLTCVSMGNPHAVMFCDDVVGVPLADVGSRWERAAFFPNRANIHFVQVNGRDEITMRTWERGSGATLACGTGACAAVVAGGLTGRTGRRLLAHLPGGDLELDWSEADNHVYMTGPAVEVFAGDWPA